MDSRFQLAFADFFSRVGQSLWLSLFLMMKIRDDAVDVHQQFATGEREYLERDIGVTEATEITPDTVSSSKR